MGYLEDLRKAKEAGDNPKPPLERPKSDDELLEERGRRALWKSGVTETITLLRDQFRVEHQRVYTFDQAIPDKGIYSTHLNWHFNGDPFAFTSKPDEKKHVDVTVEKDGSFTIEGELSMKISQEEYRKNPNAVTDALGQAVARPRLSSRVRPPSLDTTPSERITEGGGGGVGGGGYR